MLKLKKLPSPADTQAFPAIQQEAARAVAARLEKDGEKPREFHAAVSSEEVSNVLVFHLWHDSAFVELAKAGGFFPGNPGGKCLDVHYDLKSKNVTHVYGWQ